MSGGLTHLLGFLFVFVIESGAVQLRADNGEIAAVTVVIFIAVLFIIPSRAFWFPREVLKAVLDEIPLSGHGRILHQFVGRQASHVVGSVLDYGTNDNFEAKRVERGKYGEVDAFEGAGYGFTATFLRVRVLVVAEET